MKKIITVIAIVLVIATLCCVFAACNSTKGLKFKKTSLSVDYDEPVTLTKATDVSELSGASVSGSGVLLKVEKTNAVAMVSTYSVYNLKTGKIVKDNIVSTQYSRPDMDFFTYGDNAYFVVVTRDLSQTPNYTVELYTGEGSKVASFTTEDESKVETELAKLAPSTFNGDVMTFNNTYYRVSYDSFAIDEIGEVDYFRPFDKESANTTIDYSNDKYYYCFNDAKAYIYDKSLKLVSTYYVSGDVDKSDIWVLDSGDLFVQVIFEQMDEEKDYTFVSDKNKYLLKQYTVRAKDGKVSNENLKYLVRDITPMSGNLVSYPRGDKMAITSSDIENKATLYPIEDKKLLSKDTDKMIVSLSNKISIKGRLDQMVENQTPGTDFETFKGYLIAETPAGDQLLTTSGSVIGYFDENKVTNSTNKYMIVDNKIYDFNLNKLQDLDGYSIVRMMKNSIILSKVDSFSGTTQYYRFTDGVMTSLSATATYSFSSDYYYVETMQNLTTGMSYYTYYNENGTKITDSASELTPVASLEDGTTLFRYTVNNNLTGVSVTGYYRVTAE